MAWKTPITWATGVVVTETMLNEQVRDNENYLKAHVDATSGVHGSPTGAYALATKNGVGRHIEYGTVTITGTGIADETSTQSGTWEHAFASGCTWALATVLDAASVYGPRCSITVQSVSATGFTVRAPLQYMNGSASVVVVGLGH